MFRVKTFKKQIKMFIGEDSLVIHVLILLIKELMKLFNYVLCHEIHSLTDIPQWYFMLFF